MYVAISRGNKVLEVACSESSSLDGMIAYAKLGYKNLRRFITNENAFVRYSEGAELTVGEDFQDYKNCYGEPCCRRILVVDE